MTDDNQQQSAMREDLAKGNFSKVRDDLLIRSGEIKMGLQLIQAFETENPGKPEPEYIAQLREEFTQAKTMNDFSLTMVDLFLLDADQK